MITTYSSANLNQSYIQKERIYAIGLHMSPLVSTQFQARSCSRTIAMRLWWGSRIELTWVDWEEQCIHGKCMLYTRVLLYEQTCRRWEIKRCPASLLLFLCVQVPCFNVYQPLKLKVKSEQDMRLSSELNASIRTS